MTWTAAGIIGNSPIGPVTINSGTLVLKSSGLLAGQAIANNATLQYDAPSQSQTLSGVISGTGPLKVSNGTLTLSGASTYNGTTTVSAGKLVFRGSKSGSGNITVAAGAALGVTDTGTQVTPGTLTLGTSAGATLEFNNVNSTTTAPLAAGTLSSAGTVTVNINSGTFSVEQSHPLLTWTSGSAPTATLGALNGALGNLSISGNTLRLNITGLAYVGSGANNGIWDTATANNWNVAGSPATFADGGAALLDDTATGTTNVTLKGVVQPASVTVNNSSKTYSTTSSSGNYIGGSGGLIKNGNGTLTLEAGTTLAPGASAGTLTINGDLTIGGNLAIEVNKSLSPSSDLVVVSGVLTKTGTGTLTVANLGPALAIGDKFTLFSQPVVNGAALTITGVGATWINSLAADGSITVSSLVGPPTLNFTHTGNSLQFSWTGSFKVQAQTNSIDVGLSTNWADYPGGGTSPVTVPIDVTKGTVFFRLVSTP